MSFDVTPPSGPPAPPRREPEPPEQSPRSEGSPPAQVGDRPSTGAAQAGPAARSWTPGRPVDPPGAAPKPEWVEGAETESWLPALIMQPEKTSSPPWILIGAVVAIVALVAVIVVRSLGGEPAEESPAAGPARIGDSVEVGDLTFKVLSTRPAPAPEFIEPDPGNVFFGISVEITNESDEAQIVSSLVEFQLRDSQGRAYQQVSGDDSLQGTIPVGGKFVGEVLYEIPQGATGLQLVISSFGQFFAPDAKTVRLS